MVSREELNSLLKVQNDAFQSNIQNVISIFETRVTQLESSLREAEIEIAVQKQLITSQSQELSQLKNTFDASGQGDFKALKERIDDLEDRSRRNNLRFEGLEETSEENWEQTAEKVSKLLKDKLQIRERVEIERAHRVGKKSPGQSRTIVAKFLRFSDRDKILQNSKNLKGTNVYINEDLSEASLHKRKELLPQLKQARAAGKIAYFSHTRLIIKDKPISTGTSVNVAASASQSASSGLGNPPPSQNTRASSGLGNPPPSQNTRAHASRKK